MLSDRAIRRASSGLKYISLAAVLAVFVVCLRIEAENRRLTEANGTLRDRQRQIMAVANSPILIRGLTLSLLSQMELIEQHGGAVGRDRPQRQLILIYRSGCNACEQQMGAWDSFVADRRLADVETWLVSVGQSHGEMETVIRTLQSRGSAYKVFRVNKTEPFAVTTGVRAVPVTLITQGKGAESVLEFAQQGVGDISRLNLLLDAMSNTTPRRGARIEPDGQLDPL